MTFAIKMFVPYVCSARCLPLAARHPPSASLPPPRPPPRRDRRPPGRPIASKCKALPQMSGLAPNVNQAGWTTIMSCTNEWRRRIGRIGKIGRIGGIGGIGRIGRIGGIGRIGRIGRISRIGRIAHLSFKNY